MYIFYTGIPPIMKVYRDSCKYLIILPGLKGTFVKVTILIRIDSKAFQTTEIFQIEVMYSAFRLCVDITKYIIVIQWILA